MEKDRVIEVLERVAKKVEALDANKIQKDFSDPATAVKGYVKRIIDAEITAINGKLPDPDDIVITELANMFG